MKEIPMSRQALLDELDAATKALKEVTAKADKAKVTKDTKKKAYDTVLKNYEKVVNVASQKKDKAYADLCEASKEFEKLQKETTEAQAPIQRRIDFVKAELAQELNLPTVKSEPLFDKENRPYYPSRGQKLDSYNYALRRDGYRIRDYGQD